MARTDAGSPMPMPGELASALKNRLADVFGAYHNQGKFVILSGHFCSCRGIKSQQFGNYLRFKNTSRQAKVFFYTILRRIQWKTTFPLIKLEVFHARLAGYLAMHLEKIRQRVKGRASRGEWLAYCVFYLCFCGFVDLRDFSR